MKRTRNMDWYYSLTPAQKKLYNDRVYSARRAQRLRKKPDVVFSAEREFARASTAVCNQKARLVGKGLNQAQYFERMRPQIQRKAAAADALERARADWSAEKELAGLLR